MVLKPEQKIIINEKYENDFLETVKCLTHEMRHIFQIYAVKIIDNELTRVWKEELAQGEYSAKNDENSVECDDYSMRSIELDAYAFSQYYLSKYGVIFKYKNALYQKLVEQYINKYLVE